MTTLAPICDFCGESNECTLIIQGKRIGSDESICAAICDKCVDDCKKIVDRKRKENEASA